MHKHKFEEILIQQIIREIMLLRNKEKYSPFLRNLIVLLNELELYFFEFENEFLKFSKNYYQIKVDSFSKDSNSPMDKIQNLYFEENKLANEILNKESSEILLKELDKSLLLLLQEILKEKNFIPKLFEESDFDKLKEITIILERCDLIEFYGKHWKCFLSNFGQKNLLKIEDPEIMEKIIGFLFKKIF